MIPYIEILKWNSDQTKLESFAVIEPSQCWFEVDYFNIGECEIYTPASIYSLASLQKGFFVRIPNKPYLWLIKSIQYEYNSEGARMIDAKGFDAKWIISQRIIRDPLQLPLAIDEGIDLLFKNNLGTDAIEARQIKGFNYDLEDIAGISTSEPVQATRGNLWDFISNQLKLYKIGAIATLGNDGKATYKTILGQDRSESVIFSQSFDNLISATYYTSDAELKTNAQIVSTFTKTIEDEHGTRTTTSEDYVEYYPNEEEGATGINRAEMIVQSNLSTKIKDEAGQEIEIDPSSTTYKNMQKAEGAAKLTGKIKITEFNGDIDIQNSLYEFEKNFFIGDLVGIKDEYFNYAAKARIIKYTFKQDEKGYGEEAEYSTE